MALRDRINVGARINQQSLSNVLHGKIGLICDIELIETLRNYLIKVFIEKLCNALYGVFECKVDDRVTLKVVFNSLSLVFSELGH